MKKIKYFGHVNQDGILKLFNRDGFSDDLKTFLNQDVEITIEIKNKRTLPQNGFYWSNFIPSEIECFKERFGETYNKSQIHDWNKANFFASEHVLEETGEVIKIPESSAAQGTKEFEEKLENCRQWFRQNMDWEIPYPKHQTDLNFER